MAMYPAQARAVAESKGACNAIEEVVATSRLTFAKLDQ